MEGLGSDALVSIVIFLGVLAGVLMRTVLPYLSKVKAQQEADPSKPVTFEGKYMATFGITFLQSLVVTTLVVSSAPIPKSGVSLLFVFAGAFSWAYASNDIANRTI